MLKRQRLLTENRIRDDSKLKGRRIYHSERVGTQPVAATEQEYQAFRIKVCIRVRPLNQRQNIQKSITVESEESLRMDWIDKKPRQYNFRFDRVFDETASNRTIYTEVASPLIAGLLQGYNASIFAYGATGSGKTYTMFGTDIQFGTVQLSLKGLFQELEPRMQQNDFLVKLTCVELYNQNLFDLLSEQLNQVDLRESPSRGVFLAGASEVLISSEKQANRLLKRVSGRRQTQATSQNQSSSRSHAIIQISVEQKERCQGLQQQITYSKLSLIDLAGSQKAGTSLNSYESKKINQSLLVLGNCIHQLARNSEKGSHNHVPFRDSKLTRLLKDSLGGNTRTAMISTVSPSVSSYDESYNTLVYSNYTNKIQVKLKKNHKKVDKTHVADYARIIAQLRGENDKIRAQLGTDYSSNRSEAEKYELEKSFQNEVQIRQKLMQVEEKLQSLQFDEFRTMYAKSKGQKMFRGKGDPSELEKLRQQRNALTQEYNSVRQRRKQMLDRVKPTQRGEVMEYINNKVLQFEISQLQSQKIQKSKKTTELQAQRIEVNLLLDQLKRREHIIIQQNEMLGREDSSSRQYHSVKDEPPQTPPPRKDEEWFYSFLESLQSKDPIKLLPNITRLKSQSHHTKPLESHNIDDPSSESKLPQFRKMELKQANHRRLRSRSIKQKSTSKDEELNELSRNEYSQFLERNISRYQSYKSKKL